MSFTVKAVFGLGSAGAVLGGLLGAVGGPPGVAVGAGLGAIIGGAVGGAAAKVSGKSNSQESEPSEGNNTATTGKRRTGFQHCATTWDEKCTLNNYRFVPCNQYKLENYVIHCNQRRSFYSTIYAIALQGNYSCIILWDLYT